MSELVKKTERMPWIYAQSAGEEFERGLSAAADAQAYLLLDYMWMERQFLQSKAEHIGQGPDGKHVYTAEPVNMRYDVQLPDGKWLRIEDIRSAKTTVGEFVGDPNGRIYVHLRERATE